MRFEDMVFSFRWSSLVALLLLGAGCSSVPTMLSSQMAPIAAPTPVETTPESVATTPASDKRVTGYSFECGTSTDLYREYSDGEKELVAAHLDQFASNMHQDCFNVETSDTGTDFASAQTLYLLQWIGHNAGYDGYFEFNLAKKTLTRSSLTYKNLAPPSMSDTQSFGLMPGTPDADGEIRSLSFINFRDGTSSTVASLPAKYTYVQSIRSNEVTVDVEDQMDIQWAEAYRPVVSVFSTQDKVSDCNSDANPAPCRIRVPVFKIELDLSQPQNQQEIR